MQLQSGFGPSGSSRSTPQSPKCSDPTPVRCLRHHPDRTAPPADGHSPHRPPAPPSHQERGPPPVPPSLNLTTQGTGTRTLPPLPQKWPHPTPLPILPPHRPYHSNLLLLTIDLQSGSHIDPLAAPPMGPRLLLSRVFLQPPRPPR